MAYCVKCGAKVQDGAKFCPECGASIPEGQAENKDREQYTYTNQDTWNYSYQGGGYQKEQQNGYQHSGPGGNQQHYQYKEEKFEKEDVQRNKVMGVLSYIGILVLVPLLAGNKSSPYLRHHLNQGIVLWITSLILNLITNGSLLGYQIFYHYSWGLSLVGGVLSLVLFILAIAGIVSACKGTKNPLPVVGSIRIFQ